MAPDAARVSATSRVFSARASCVIRRASACASFTISSASRSPVARLLRRPLGRDERLSAGATRARGNGRAPPRGAQLLSARSARSRQDRLVAVRRSPSTSRPPPAARSRSWAGESECRISTGVSAMLTPSAAGRRTRARSRGRGRRPSARGRAEGWHDASEDPQVRLADVVEETLDPVQPREYGSRNQDERM